jgi:hypothetical protein
MQDMNEEEGGGEGKEEDGEEEWGQTRTGRRR